MNILKLLIPLGGMLVICIFFSCKKSSPKPIPPDTPPANLIAYWTLNNNANDASRYGNNGTAYHVIPATDRFGNANSALYFDGQHSYISVPDSSKLRLANTDFTLNAWVKLDSYSWQNASAIISKRISGANHGWLWAINGRAASPVGTVFFGSGGYTPNAIGTMMLDTGKWYMISCVYNLAGQSLSIYVNGTLDKTVMGIQSPSGSIASALYIGQDVLDSGESSEYNFQGTLDEIRIYNTALNIAAIRSLYNSTN